MLLLGQTELFLKSDFKSFWKSLLAVPTIVELERVVGPISKEQISHALQSNEIKYKIYDAFWPLTSFFSTTLPFVWPVIFHTHVAIILLQILVLRLFRKTHTYRKKGLFIIKTGYVILTSKYDY